MTVPVPAGAGGVDREAIRARCDAATPGPWHVEESPWDIPGTTEVDRIVCGPTPTAGAPRDGIADVFDGHWVDGVEDRGPAPNLEFIAHARSDVSALLAALAAAEQRADTLAAAIGRAADIHRPKRVQVGKYGDVCVKCCEPYPCSTVAALSSRPVQPATCDTCEGAGAVRIEAQIGAPGSGGWITCPDCGPTPSEAADEPVQPEGKQR